MKYIVTLLVLIGLVVSASAADHKAQNLITSAGTITLAASTTTNLPVAVSRSAGLWSNPDGSNPNAALMISCIGTNANATNTVAITLYTVPDGENVSTSSLNTMTFTINANGTTRATASTNVPTAILQGAKAIKITSIVTGSSAAGGGALTITPKLVGFVP